MTDPVQAPAIVVQVRPVPAAARVQVEVIVLPDDAEEGA